MRREALEKARLAVIVAQKELDKAKEKVEQLKKDLREKNQELIDNNYDQAENYLRLIRSLDERLEEAKKEVIQREKDLQDRKEELIEAQVKLEVLEKLKEKQAEEYKLEMDRLEQKATDEKVSIKYLTENFKKAQEAEEEY